MECIREIAAFHIAIIDWPFLRFYKVDQLLKDWKLVTSARFQEPFSEVRLGKGVGQWLTRSLGASLPKSIRTDNPGARLLEFAIFAIAID